MTAAPPPTPYGALPRPLAAAVNIIRVTGAFGAAMSVLGMLGGVALVAPDGLAVSLMYASFFLATGLAMVLVTFAVAREITRRERWAYLAALVFCGAALGASDPVWQDGRLDLGFLYYLVLIVLLTRRSSWRYMTGTGPPLAPRPPGALQRLDNAVLGPPGTTTRRIRRALRRS